MTEADAVHADWPADFAHRATAADVLPAHHPECLGCGPDNPHGHHLQARRAGERVVSQHIFDARHVGAPGIAHGGAVATVVDDLFGFLLYLVGEPAVTRHLEIDYHAPVRLRRRYALEARLERREGRKLFVRATGTDDAGSTAFTAQAVFIVVPLQHFSGETVEDRPAPS